MDFDVWTQAGAKPSSQFDNAEIQRCCGPDCRQFVHRDFPPEWEKSGPNGFGHVQVDRFCSAGCHSAFRVKNEGSNGCGTLFVFLMGFKLAVVLLIWLYVIFE